MNALTLEEQRQCVAARNIIAAVNRRLANAEANWLTILTAREVAYEILRRHGQAAPPTHPLLIHHREIAR